MPVYEVKVVRRTVVTKLYVADTYVNVEADSPEEARLRAMEAGNAGLLEGMDVEFEHVDELDQEGAKYPSTYVVEGEPELNEAATPQILK